MGHRERTRTKCMGKVEEKDSLEVRTSAKWPEAKPSIWSTDEYRTCSREEGGDGCPQDEADDTPRRERTPQRCTLQMGGRSPEGNLQKIWAGQGVLVTAQGTQEGRRDGLLGLEN